MRIELGSKSLVGFLFSSPLIYNFLKSVLDWKGRYDAAASIKEASGDKMIDLLSKPSHWFYLVALIVGLLLIWWDARRPSKGRSVTITPFMLAIFVTLAASASWGWYFYDRSRGPIAWGFDKTEKVLAMQPYKDAGMYVYAFGIEGVNVSGGALRHIGGYIKSDNIGVELPLRISVDGRYVAPESIESIPKGATVGIRVEVPGDTEQGGLPARKFIAEFGGSTLAFQYDGKTAKRSFSKDALQREIDEWIERTMPEVAKIKIREPDSKN